VTLRIKRNLPKLRWSLLTRTLLAGPVAVAISLLVLAGMPLWLPAGAAGVDHIALPLLLLPAVWALLFFHALLDRSLARVALVALALVGLNLALLVRHFAATPATRVGETMNHAQGSR
jgi:hypothetical protein